MLQLYLIKEPERTLILVSNEFVLTFKKTTNNNQNSSVIVDFLPINDVDLIEAILLYDISGLLGLLDIGGCKFFMEKDHDDRIQFNKYTNPFDCHRYIPYRHHFI